MTVTEPATTEDVLDELRTFLEENWDPEMTVREWWSRLGLAGWSAPGLPTNAYGRGVARLLVIAPFFVMPTVSALVWKNMLMHPVNGLFAYIWKFFGAQPIDWLSELPLFSIILIVAWQWLPFATLILLTAIQSLDSEQLEAAEMDGAGALSRFAYIILPHLSRAITVVILIQTIFLLSIFAEIFVTTGGAFGTRTLTYLVYQRVIESQNIGLGSAGGIFAVILANIVAIFLMRIVGKNLDT